MPFDALQSLESKAWFIKRSNVDTDIIFPARFLLHIQRSGMGRFAFHDWRRGADGGLNPDFPDGILNPGERQILIAGNNFGCGSSREQAVWALADLGLRCIISPSFGEIFYNNCFKNGILPIKIDDEVAWSDLSTAATNAHTITVNLETKKIIYDKPAQQESTAESAVIEFDVPAFYRDSLLNGWDEIDRMLAQDRDDIQAFEARRQGLTPWLFRSLDNYEQR